MKHVKKNKRSRNGRSGDSGRMLGDKLNFTATEAYKLLRTNLFFCLPAGEENSCRVVGITSSVQGEGKSTTSINLAYMLAEDGKRVCLIEGDMRAPTFNSRLQLHAASGMSHVLAGMKSIRDCMSKTDLQSNLIVIPAGEMPPNPAELLGSGRMTQVVELLREVFDYIIVDLPPITVVADALAVSGSLDGMIIVVEEGVTTKRELSDAMQRLNVIKDKILGFVVTRAGSSRGKYGYYRKKYGYGYYRRMEYGPQK